MFFSYDKLISIIWQYVDDERHNQAILIDGDWGTGKTHFIMSKLKPALQNFIKEKDATSKRKIIYISLYGIESCKQILDELCSLIMFEKIEDKIGFVTSENLSKGAGFITKIISTAASAFNIDTEKGPSLSDFANLKDAVIIFDDLERCGIGINETLGFLNNLVEHNDIKVIIVANQKEIGKINLTENLPEKYSVILSSGLKIKTNDNKGKNRNDNEKFSENELREYAERLFSNDILYGKIKEKLIGITLYFQPDFGELFDDIIDKYVQYLPAKNFIVERKKEIISIFEIEGYYNLRTLIFALMSFEKIYKILCTLKYESEYLDVQKNRILIYCINLAIIIKTGKEPYAWETGTKHGEISSRDVSLFTSRGGLIYAYRFVDKYMLNHDFDEKEIISCVSDIIDEQIQRDEEKKYLNDLYKNDLYMWWQLEDFEITERLQGILNDLKENKYPIHYYKDIIVYLFQLKNHGFSVNMDDFVELMTINTENINEPIDMFKLELLSDDKGFIMSYNKLMEPIFANLQKKHEGSLYTEINKCFENIETWGNDFYEYCVAHKQEFLTNYKFFYTLDVNNLLTRINGANLNNISGFLSGINGVYSFSNLKDFFVADLPKLNDFNERISIECDSITRKMVLEKIKNKITDVIQILQ